MKLVAAEATIGIIGAGTMGSGIAQLAATAGHEVIVYDSNSEALRRSYSHLDRMVQKDVEKKRIDARTAILIRNRIKYEEDSLKALARCSFVIEAVIEELDVKHAVFKELETVVREEAILATNTSSLSITAIASACKKPARVVGMHFFNPVPLMPLVEVIPGMKTTPAAVEQARHFAVDWGKIPVTTKDTPGFIVNRVARPFYGEALRIYEEGIADFATIDWAMREIGGFRMGPFELMDLIGNDVNYKVTQSVFESSYYDPRYKPSLTQKRMVEAGSLGRKTGQGYYPYDTDASGIQPNKDKALGEAIFMRILCMLINEAADAVAFQIAAPADIDLAMTKGVNYPKGLLAWADEIGVKKVLATLENLHEEYGEERYRVSHLLRKVAKNGGSLVG